ncbi:MAG: helix-turn-helix domain-containing protein [Candidatus Saccharicenans sp.]
MESLGKQLQNEREKKGINLKDISLQTKIGLRHLEAIENDRLDLLPGGFFTRQILKTYLTSIGLNPQDWLAKYLAAGLIESEETLARKPKKSESDRSDVLRKLFSGLVVLAVILAVGALVLFSIKSSKKTAENLKKQATVQMTAEKKENEAEIPKTQEVPADRALKTAAEAAPAPEYQGLNLELNFTEECWIQVYADGRLVLDGLKLEGYKTTVKAENELQINIGNAGALTYSLNGKPGKPLGKRGAVLKNIKITRDNMQQFIAESAPQ